MKLKQMVAAAALGLGACSHAGNGAGMAAAETASLSSLTDSRDDGQVVKVWPLRFTRHGWSINCYDTLYCRAWYGGISFGEEEPTQPSSAYGPGYLDHWNAGFDVANFPPPAEVKWQTRDGRWHHTYIDIGAIFKDEKVLHNVPREEVRGARNGRPAVPPDVLMEVNGNTIRIYMKATIGTKHMQRPGNPHSFFRDDLILVKTLHY